MESFSWALSDGTGQEFGFALDGKWLAMEQRRVIKLYAVMHCERICKEAPDRGRQSGSEIQVVIGCSLSVRLQRVRGVDVAMLSSASCTLHLYIEASACVQESFVSGRWPHSSTDSTVSNSLDQV